VVHAAAKGVLDRDEIRHMAVSGELHAIREATGQILDENFCRRDPATPDHPRADELRVGIERGPRPYVAVAEHALLVLRHVALFRITETPNLIALDALAREIAESLVLK